MSPGRARVALTAGVLAWLAATWFLARTAAVTVPALGDRATGPDDALVAVAALLGLAVLAWFAAAFTATALAAVLPRHSLRGGAARRLSPLLTPVAARRFLSVAVAAALVGGVTPAQAVTRAPGPVVTSSAPASPSSAYPGPAYPGPVYPAPAYPGPGTVGETRAADEFPGDRLDPGWAPSAAAGREQPVQARFDAAGSLDPAWGLPGRLRPGTDPETDVVVRRGDTLWDIAARHLGPGATDAEIAHAWPLWYAANRSTIGSDPDRLSPGQRLQPPAPTPGGSP